MYKLALKNPHVSTLNNTMGILSVKHKTRGALLSVVVYIINPNRTYIDSNPTVCSA